MMRRYQLKSESDEQDGSASWLILVMWLILVSTTFREAVIIFFRLILDSAPMQHHKDPDFRN